MVTKLKPYAVNWKTTCAAFGKLGIIVAIIAAVITVEDPEPLVIALLGAYGVIDVSSGIVTRDADKSSQESGVRP